MNWIVRKVMVMLSGFSACSAFLCRYVRDTACHHCVIDFSFGFELIRMFIEPFVVVVSLPLQSLFGRLPYLIECPANVTTVFGGFPLISAILRRSLSFVGSAVCLLYLLAVLCCTVFVSYGTYSSLYLRSFAVGLIAQLALVEVPRLSAFALVKSRERFSNLATRTTLGYNGIRHGFYSFKSYCLGPFTATTVRGSHYFTTQTFSFQTQF
ncbi:MAG: hypothetical protein KKD00_06735 [Gammaproteobacteria bacterium]|nr:hypothetical protein [Gammaproteobacteria bacterium]